MDEIKLTRDADTMICVIYKDYLERRKKGTPKGDAKLFGGSSYIHENLLPKWSFEDVDETCRELSRAGLLNCLFADNVTYMASLSDDAIIYMENRFSDGLKSLLGYLKDFLPILPA